MARHVRCATAGVFIHVEDRGPKHNAAMEGLRPPQQKRMKYAGWQENPGSEPMRSIDGHVPPIDRRLASPISVD